MSELKLEGLNELSDKLKIITDKYPWKVEEELTKLGKSLKKKAINITPVSKIKHKNKLVKSYKLSPVKYSRYGTSYITLTNTSPHFHLVEKGHSMVTKDGKTIGYVPGKHMLENASTELDNEMPNELDKWADELLGDAEK